VEAAFEDAYVGMYGRRPPGVEPEVLSWRVSVSAPAPRLATGSAMRGATRERARRQIWSPEGGGMVEAEVVERAALAAGDVVEGPAVVQEDESTVVIGPGGSGRVDACGALVVELA
jgi:N-methylhydantoinase A/oxoprolinase/acetone carboxylase beta subunit